MARTKLSRGTQASPFTYAIKDNEKDMLQPALEGERLLAVLNRNQDLILAFFCQVLVKS